MLNNKRVRRILIPVLASGVAVGALASTNVARAQDTTAAAANGIVTSPAATETAAARPWTKAEMLAAIPLDTVVAGSNRGPATGPTVGANGPAGIAPGYAGASRTAAIPVVPDVADTTGDTELATFGTSGTAYTYPPPFTRFNVPTFDRSQYPYRTVGKIFFKQYGVSYVCSGSVVGTNHVLTAGHCVHKGDNKTTGWSTNIVFVPAYNAGAAPYGQWTARQSITSTDWYSKGNPGGLFRDWGGFSVNKIGTTRIGNRVGYLGRAWNQGQKQHFNDFGYPAASPFNGSAMVTCQASTNKTDTVVPGAPDPIAIGCDMTGGSSGGPWILRFTPGASGPNNYANGVNSYKYNNDPQQMYSPYADTFFQTFTNALLALVVP